MTLAAIIPSPVLACARARDYLGGHAERLAARLLASAFRSRVVQEAVAREIRCGTPLGDFFNDTISEAMDCIEVDATDIRGLDREIEEAVGQMRDEEIDVDSIKNFDEAVGAAVRSELEESDVTSALADSIVERIARRLLSHDQG